MIISFSTFCLSNFLFSYNVFGFLFAFVWGVIWGSFGSAIIYRVPRGISLLSPRRSFCPSCKKSLLWWHKIPVLSFLILRGKCAFCGNRIPIFYLLVELGSGILSALAWGISFEGGINLFTDTYTLSKNSLGISEVLIFFFLFLFFWGLFLSTVSDILYLLIPTILFYISLVSAVVIRFLLGGFWDSVLGIFAGAGVLYIVKLSYRIVRKKEGIGEGDILIMIPVGILFGFYGTLLILIFSTFMGGIFAFILALQGKGREHQIPFIPFIFAGIIIYLVISLLFPDIKSNIYIFSLT
jgi:leader peptidase (prepilin peptidase)/N-methyltransferase